MLQRVMVIDDSDADLLYTRLVLERSGAVAEVVALESARDALVLLRAPQAPRFDLVLLDINMPGMDGFDFLREYEPQWRAAQGAAPVVVMLTSSPDPADRAKALSHAVVRGYVVKPLEAQAARDLAALAAP